MTKIRQETRLPRSVTRRNGAKSLPPMQSTFMMKDIEAVDLVAAVFYPELI